MSDEMIYNIEFKDILKAVKKRFYIVILITIPTLLTGVYFGFSSTKVLYQVKAYVIVGNPLDGLGRQYEIDDVSRVQPFMETYCAIANTTAVSEKTIRQRKLDISPEELKYCISAVQQIGTPFIEMRLVWAKPQEVLEIMDTLVDVYIKEAMSLYPTYNITVIDKGKKPHMLVTSNKTLYVAGGMLAGIIASLLLIFALEFFNTNLKTQGDVEEIMQLPVLGVIPKRKKKTVKIDLEYYRRYDYSVMEAYRALRTNTFFATRQKEVQPYMNPYSRNLKTIVVTSGMPGEGKTSVASMLAALMAYDGRRIILIDCNMRKPNIQNVFEIGETGLANMFNQEIEWKSFVNTSNIENLYILGAGSIPHNPPELLSSVRMKEIIEALKNEFDYIILDTPSVNLVTDAQVLSPYVDGYIIVVSSGKSKKEDAIKAKKLIQYVDGIILGIVLNKVKDSTLNRHYKHYNEASTDLNFRR